MNRAGLILVVCGLLGACAPKETVLFVTSTSLGIDGEFAPPTLSVAYDRSEGYFAPRAADGGMPPVVASFQSDGAVLSPKLRQLYATGDAALVITGAKNATNAPSELNGLDGKMAFFGTQTTVGLKAGFDEAGAPSDFVFGLRRKELSVLPLGHEGNPDGQKYVLPSALASLDTTASAPSMKDAGLSISQFFATGQSAEFLAANNAAVRSAFAHVATNAVVAPLPSDQRQQALALADKVTGDQNAALEKVMNAVAPGGALDAKKLSDLVGKANSLKTGAVNTELANTRDAATLQSRLRDDPTTTNNLLAALMSS
jgi:hypothetical protein